MKRSLWTFGVLFLVIIGCLVLWTYKNELVSSDGDDEADLKVMVYSGFLKSWAPGPEIALEFEKKHKIKIKWIEVNNAGMILENLALRKQEKMDEKPDVVLGLDLLSLPEARAAQAWKKIRTPSVMIKDLPTTVMTPEFVPFDWAPLTFIFRRTEMPTPAHIDDLLKDSYANALALQDPRTSSTGLYFLIWTLALKGDEAGFEFLKNLKPSIRIISPSWSASYSLFQNNQAPMVFSFFTSTLYHYINEGDSRYQPVYFDDPHIYSIEYAGVPESCENCLGAQKFVQFLLTPAIQKIIMEKNYMLPVVDGVRKGTPFDFPKNIQLIDQSKLDELLGRKQELLERWKKLNL